MIVNIGAATTEISVIADARVIISKIVPLGGEDFNSDIVNTVRRKNNLSISLRTANRLKVALADLKSEKKVARKIVGMDALSGLPRERVITSQTINDSIRSSVEGIGREIRTFLERTPPRSTGISFRRNLSYRGKHQDSPYCPGTVRGDGMLHPALQVLRPLYGVWTEGDHHPRCPASLGFYPKIQKVGGAS